MKGRLVSSPNLTRWSWRFGLLLALSPIASGFGGCGADNTIPDPSKTGGGGGGGEPGVVVPKGTSLFIEVRSRSSTPIPGASVLLVDKNELVEQQATDELGQVLLQNLTPGRIVAQVHAPGFTSATAVATLEQGQHGGAVVVLHPLDDSVPFDASADAVVVSKSGVVVEIPGGSLINQNGEPVTGMANVTFAPIDPTTEQIQLAPGPFEGIYAPGEAPVNLESVFMADVSVWKEGTPLSLAPGAKAKLRFPLPETLKGKYAVGDQIEAWWFDVNIGVWVQDGTGAIMESPSGEGKLEWLAEVSHFTFWNADHPWYEKYCYDVLVVDANNAPVGNAPLTASGVSYTGQSTTKFTNASGHACVEVMKGSTAKIYLASWGATGQYKEIVAGITTADCGGISGNACESLKIVTTSTCYPGTYQTCSTYNGPPSAVGVGTCTAGIQYCNANGTGYNSCVGQVPPNATDDCSNIADDDCNGVVNNGCAVICQTGTTQSCYTGPPNTVDVGICKAGTRQCVANGTAWSQCSGSVSPSPYEYCFDNVDNDCDGTQSECTCVVGTVQTCYTALPSNTQQNPPCKPGQEYCQQKWTNGGGSGWSNCYNQTTPAPAELCVTLTVDDNCNGVVNESPCCSTAQSCGQGTECKEYVCQQGLCKSNNAPLGTPTMTQVMGDCLKAQCDGSGNIENIANDGDTPNDNNECTKDACLNGVKKFINWPLGHQCSGGLCDGNGACVQCVTGANCPLSGVCVMNICQTPSCVDTVKNGGETGVDCGGPCGPCPAGGPCAGSTDCQSSVCSSNTCQTATCVDMVKNGQETDADCGGPVCSTCGNGRVCIMDTDCTSQKCISGKCVPVSCTDTLKNNQETDVDCGGPSCNGCSAGKDCLLSSDCLPNLFCVGNKCQ